MPIYMMFGKYSAEAREGISPSRTKQAVDQIITGGGKVISK